ncbi:MAG: GNAT family N-acetyltransferase [Fimbriimonadaceae bacterium]
MSPTVRPWEPRDAEAAIEVVRSVYDEYGFTWDPDEYHADLYDVPGHYLDSGHRFWVGERDGRVRGTVALHVFDPVPGSFGEVVAHQGFLRVGGTDCALQRLYVAAEARRSGLGTALMTAAVRQAAAFGCRAMEIWSDKRFVDAHRLYRRLGARVVGERICHDPDQSPEWGLILELGAAAG